MERSLTSFNRRIPNHDRFSVLRKPYHKVDIEEFEKGAQRLRLILLRLRMFAEADGDMARALNNELMVDPHLM
jgi:hypothetical protein